MFNKGIAKFLWVWLRLVCLAFFLLGCKWVYSASTPSLTATQGGAQEIPTASSTPENDIFTEARLRMVTETIEGRGVKDPDVLRAMRSVPRHLFVPDAYIDQAYDDHPLPIGYGQTISQPYIVAWMTELMELKAGETVLEIGTGSGYQAAVLAELGYVEVYSIEIVPELAESAEDRLQSLGYAAHTKQGDGYYGWPDAGPFDAIIVTAAPDHLPAPLVAQLVDGGRLVIPIGPPGGYQSLWKFVKNGESLSAYNLAGVAFVPLTGEGSQHQQDFELPSQK
jgi:protein-L-isoaspartate(D-aspartate) O-methyltransferase